ncbi:MAG TPA: LysR family transcriptional regulator [Stellaceae bacterium]|nr:LysR family transcriptional regulator [Stellaceae bacterium]
MELRQLRHFLAVIDHGSLGDGARALSLSQPALSRSIQGLERSTKGLLFERSKRGMALTALGKALEVRARIIIAETERSERELDEILGARRGRVVIGASPTFSWKVLPSVLTRFMQDHPLVEISLTEAFAPRLFEAVMTGDIEYALMLLPGTLPHPDLTCEVLALRLPYGIVASRTNPIASLDRPRAQDIWPGPWLLPKAPGPTRESLNAAFLRFGLPAPSVALEVNAPTLKRQLLCEGLFLSVQPELAWRDELRSGLLRMLPVRGFAWHAKAVVLFRRGARFSPAAERLLVAVRKAARRLTPD